MSKVPGCASRSAIQVRMRPYFLPRSRAVLTLTLLDDPGVLKINLFLVEPADDSEKFPAFPQGMIG